MLRSATTTRRYCHGLVNELGRQGRRRIILDSGPISIFRSFRTFTQCFESIRNGDGDSRARRIPSHLGMKINIKHDWNGAMSRNGSAVRWFSNTSGSNSTASGSTSTSTATMDVRDVYSILQLRTFSDEEMDGVISDILKSGPSPSKNITHDKIRHYMKGKMEHSHLHSDPDPCSVDIYCDRQSSLLLCHFPPITPGNPLTPSLFKDRLISLSSNLPPSKILPLGLSMLLIGSSVGITAPIMPFLISELSLSPSQFGSIVSVFAAGKLLGNFPAAVLVECHGRKPYLIHSLTLIAVGVSSLGFSQTFSEMLIARFFTGVGVAALSTAVTLTVSDLSTPRNRASAMAPVHSAFAAGMAMGPGIGGYLAEYIGIRETFGVVGCCYVGMALINSFLLEETKRDRTKSIVQHMHHNPEPVSPAPTTVMAMIGDSRDKFSQILKMKKIQPVIALHGCYNFALAGTNMTVLPLFLTHLDPTIGLAMTAATLGKVYMGMSIVQVLSQPVLGPVIDRVGKVKSMVGGCTLLSCSMGLLPLTILMEDTTQYPFLAGSLLVSVLGSTVLSTAPVAYVADVVEEDKRAQGIALFRTVGDVGFLTGAVGIGAIADYSGDLGLAIWGSGSVLIVATGLFVRSCTDVAFWRGEKNFITDCDKKRDKV